MKKNKTLKQKFDECYKEYLQLCKNNNEEPRSIDSDFYKHRNWLIKENKLEVKFNQKCNIYGITMEYNRRNVVIIKETDLFVYWKTYVNEDNPPMYVNEGTLKKDKIDLIHYID